MVCLMPGPHSYTGEDVVEVYGHGGALNMDALLRVFLRLGARQAEPGEFTRRAFVNGRMDLTQAEAVAEVIAARSERALGNAQALFAGELGRKVRALRATNHGTGCRPGGLSGFCRGCGGAGVRAGAAASPRGADRAAGAHSCEL